MDTVWRQTRYQESLEKLLDGLFPQHSIHTNAKTETTDRDSNTDKYLAVDAWIPSLNLCFEYQDYYHYKPAWYCHTPLNTIQQKDDIKRTVFLNDLQTLINIPCWWSGDVTSLQATIHFHRPDLGLRHSSEIPCNPPIRFFEETQSEYPMMLASFPEDDTLELGAWWIGEKMDGIRCFWDSKEKQLYSRSKRAIQISVPVLYLFGTTEIVDAELWCGRGFFTESQIAISRYAPTLPFSHVRVVCFDYIPFSPKTPTALLIREVSKATEQESSWKGTRFTPFEIRYQALLDAVPADHPTFINAPRLLCNCEQMLQGMLHCITSEGGEGMMLRKPLSPYRPGRSHDLFKLKHAALIDRDALVMSIGADGSMVLQLHDGFTFRVRKEQVELHARASRGDIVTVRVQSSQRVWYSTSSEQDLKMSLRACLTNSVVYRVRLDLSWEPELYDSSLLVAEKFACERSRQDVYNHNKQVWNRASTRRAFFDKFAESKGMDPLNPLFWYSVTTNAFYQFDKGYKSIARHYGKTLPTILIQLYPDIGLHRNKFKATNQSWKDASARRAYFDRFAASRGMDPLNALLWYPVMPSDLVRFDKGYISICNYYGGKLSSILCDIYPNIGLKPKRFKANRAASPWKQHSARRDFFDKFAKWRGIDPLNPFAWYEVTASQVKQYNTAYKAIASNYGGKLSTILVQLYPNIGLQQKQFNEMRTLRRAAITSPPP